MVGKNYRLQDIQLSKTHRRDPGRANAYPPGHHPSAAESAEPTAADLVPPAARPTGAVLVENTGLEPVTSWLQTKRSPS